MNYKKFIWIGRNKKFNELIISPALTTTELMSSRFPSFFALSNRDGCVTNGNCEFLMEIFEGDEIWYCNDNSISTFTAIAKDELLYGEGPFNTVLVSEYFKASDFVSAKNLTTGVEIVNKARNFEAMKDDISNSSMISGALKYTKDEMTGKRIPCIMREDDLFSSCVAGTEKEVIKFGSQWEAATGHKKEVKNEI
jgi:hypothetical protein